MPLKLTFMFELTTQTKTGSATSGAGREAGWVESFYLNVDGVLNSAVPDAISNFCTARLRILANQGRITAVRIHDLTTNATRFYPLGYGFFGTAGDCTLPSDAVLVRLFSSNGINSRAYDIRGIPGFYNVTGELVPGLGTNVAMKVLLNFICRTFGMLGTDKSHPHFAVNTISTGGIVALAEDQTGIAVGNYVRFFRTHFDDSCCGSVGKFKVTAVAATALTLANWDATQTASGGKVGVSTPPAFITYDATAVGTVANGWSVERLVTRKTGRPFDLFSGRRSKTCCQC